MITTLKLTALVVVALALGIALAMATGHLHVYSNPTPTIVLDHTAIQFNSSYGWVCAYYWE